MVFEGCWRLGMVSEVSETWAVEQKEGHEQDEQTGNNDLQPTGREIR